MSTTGAIGWKGCAELPVVPAARRAAILDGPATPEAHAALLAELPFAEAVEVQAPRAEAVLGPTARVLAWNVERGRDLARLSQLVVASGADLVLLSELDHGMARTGQLHVARELAWLLGFGYAYGVEFLELGLGSPEERAALPADARNAVGYHGNAILSRTPLARPALVRLDAGGDWFDGARGERRVGTRIAVLAQVMLAGAPVTVASAHLESHGDPAQRAAQMGALLDAVDEYDARAPVVVGGDLNTFSLALSRLGEPGFAAEALRADPERWRHPERHEPLFPLLAARGYEWHAANVPGEGTHRHPTDSGSARSAFKLDWLLVRGLRAADPVVIPAVHPLTGAALSDHEAVATTIG